MTVLSRRDGFGGERRSPEVTVLDEVPVDPTVTILFRPVLDDDDYGVASSAAPVGRARGGVSQFFLEFGGAVTNLVLGFAKAIIGLGMYLGGFGVVMFVALYFLLKHDYALTLAALSGVLAFASFTFCYLSGVIESKMDRFIAKGRRA